MSGSASISASFWCRYISCSAWFAVIGGIAGRSLLAPVVMLVAPREPALEQRHLERLITLLERQPQLASERRVLPAPPVNAPKHAPTAAAASDKLQVTETAARNACSAAGVSFPACARRICTVPFLSRTSTASPPHVRNDRPSTACGRGRDPRALASGRVFLTLSS